MYEIHTMSRSFQLQALPRLANFLISFEFYGETENCVSTENLFNKKNIEQTNLPSDFQHGRSQLPRHIKHKAARYWKSD